MVDVFGEIDHDGAGQPWDYLDGWAKRSTFTGPDGSTFVLGSWTFSAPNATDGCLTNDTCGSVFPLGGFECDPAVATEDASWGSIKTLYR